MVARRACRLPIVLILLLTAAPAAAADGHHGDDDTGPWQLSLSAAAHDAPILPLSDFAQIPLTVSAPCEAVEGRNLSLPVHLAITDKPPWVQATVSPATVHIRNGTCAAPTREVAATLLVQTTAEAPAFQAANVSLAARTPEEGYAPAAANATIAADYFSILDATTPEPVMTVRPGARVEVPVTITNFGNDATRVRLAVDDATQGVDVTVPGPVVVGATQQGAPRNNVTLPVVVRAPAPTGLVNQKGVAHIDVASALAGNASRAGMDARVTVLFNVKGLHVPGGGGLALLGLAAGVGLASRRRPRPGR